VSVPLKCPGTDDWQALDAVSLSPEQWEPYERHLESCPVCQERIDQAEARGEALLGLARQVGDPTVAPPDPTLVQVLERLHEGKPPEKTTAGPADLHFLRPTDRPDLLGMLGPFEVREVLGHGGMGVVLRAFEPALRREVAIKVLAPALACSATARQRFKREAQAAAAVSHEHVVRVHGVHEADGLPYLVMQYVAGESLQARLNRAGPLDVAEVVRIGSEAASGLAAAHARGLIHRDVKPANILIEEGTGRVKITDFGLARLADDVGLTRSGVVTGTPEYMAPEQARGEPVDPRSDLFALGAVLYACCTGHPPFRATTALAVLRRVTDETPAPVRALKPAVPAWLGGLVAQLLAKDPAERPPSAAAVAALLDGYRAHLRRPATVPAPALPAPTGSRRPTRSSLRLPALVLAVLVLVAGGVVLGLGPPAGPGDRPAEGRNEPPRFYQDFRGKPINEEFFQYMGLRDLIKEEPEGLRITLPGPHAQAPASGVATGFHVTGDFSITTSYELLRVDDSKPSWGAGASLYLYAGNSAHDAAMIANFVRPDGHFYTCSKTLTNAEGKRQFFTHAVPTQARSGKLRLVRRGAVVTYLVADGGTDTFQELHQFEVTADDFAFARVAADCGNKDILVDVRFHDLEIRSPDLPGEARTDAAGQPLPREKRWLPAAELIVLAIALSLMVALGVGLYRRRPRHGDRRPAANGAALAFACSACGKDLKARPALAGKKVRCIHCRGVVLIPATSADGHAPP
jgi:serine/threonine-protein kinase